MLSVTPERVFAEDSLSGKFTPVAPTNAVGRTFPHSDTRTQIYSPDCSVSRKILPEFPGFTKHHMRNSEENSVNQNSGQPEHFRKDEEFHKTDVIGLLLAVRKATLL